MKTNEVDLCLKYEAWLTANGFKNASSADEFYGEHFETLTYAQRMWLCDFIEEWQETVQ
jgi:hypothetical protein